MYIGPWQEYLLSLEVKSRKSTQKNKVQVLSDKEREDILEAMKSSDLGTKLLKKCTADNSVCHQVLSIRSANDDQITDDKENNTKINTDNSSQFLTMNEADSSTIQEEFPDLEKGIVIEETHEDLNDTNILPSILNNSHKITEKLPKEDDIDELLFWTDNL